MTDAAKGKYELATFAGGCFWCMVAPFVQLDGVLDVASGYTGGMTENPTYAEVCEGKTGHYEAVEVRFDPERVNYTELLDVFWRSIDPTDAGGQFHDRGHSYTTAIFYHNESQRQQAEASKKTLDASRRFPRPIMTTILPAAPFYPAEDYHQDYYRKNPQRYELYRLGSGRDAFIKEHWTKKDMTANLKDREALQHRLTKLQFDVTQNNATEPPFRN